MPPKLKRIQGGALGVVGGARRMLLIHSFILGFIHSHGGPARPHGRQGQAAEFATPTPASTGGGGSP